jgi:hypothetical protein
MPTHPASKKRDFPVDEEENGTGTKHRRRTDWHILVKKKVVQDQTIPVKTAKPKKVIRQSRRFNPEKEGQKRDPIPLKVRAPIFVASLPKSGTTSVFQYFNCGGHPASHQWVKYNETSNEQSGKCIRRNVQNNRPPFQNCGSSDIFTDTGFAVYLSGGKLPDIPTDCYYPSIQALDAIYKYYPESTIINVVRDAARWLESMQSWGQGSLLKRWMLCDAPGLPQWHATKEDFIGFYQWHTQQIRDFAATHPTLVYIEVMLESSNAGRIMEEAIGIPSRCWGKCSPDSVFCERLETGNIHSL